MCRGYVAGQYWLLCETKKTTLTRTTAEAKATGSLLDP